MGLVCSVGIFRAGFNQGIRENTQATGKATMQQYYVAHDNLPRTSPKMRKIRISAAFCVAIDAFGFINIFTVFVYTPFGKKDIIYL